MALGPLLGLLALLSGLFFLLALPFLAAVCAWQDRRRGRMSTGLLVSAVMLVAFYACAGLIWRLGTADWPLSFLTTLEAAADAAKYGHPVEHRAEVMVVSLLLTSTLTAVVAGTVTAAARRSWTKRRREQRPGATGARNNPATD